METITVFRCGSMAQPLHTQRILSSFRFFDSVAPEGRVLRGNAIFASPERLALAPWIAMKHRKKRRAGVRGSINPEFDQDVLVRHLELELDSSLFVYDADLFGRIHLEAHEHGFKQGSPDASLYWDSGIPLAEWRNSQFANTPAAESWEVLVAPHHLRNVVIEPNLTENVSTDDPVAIA